jgi:hypothetical protein
MLHTAQRNQGFFEEIMAFLALLMGDKAHPTGIPFFNQPRLTSVAILVERSVHANLYPV